MKKYTILFICSISFLGSAQNRYTTEKLYNNSFYFTNYNMLIDSISKDEENLKPKKQLDYGVSINQSITKYGLPTSVLFTLNFKKHQFDLGPKFGLGEFAIAYQRVIGAEFNYKFYLLGDTKWYNPYLLLNVGYLNYNTSYTDIYNSHIRDTKNSFELNLGIGIKFAIVKGFYVGTHIGLGTFNGVQQDIIDGKVTNKTNEKSGGFLGSVFLGYKF